jgi:hypothetical protein
VPGSKTETGLVSDGLLLTGGLSIFGNKKMWDDAPPPFATATEAAAAAAVKSFDWLWRVASNLKLMEFYNDYFKTTQQMQLFLTRLRVRTLPPLRAHALHSSTLFTSHAHTIQMVEINSMVLYQMYVKDIIGGKDGITNLEEMVFVQLQTMTTRSMQGYATRIRSLLSATYKREGKTVDISPLALLNEAQSLYVIAAFSLRDELLSNLLSTLAAQIAALHSVVQQSIGIRFHALPRAHALIGAIDFSKVPGGERDAARLNVKREVDSVFANLPVVSNLTTYDAPEIVSVGLSEKVTHGNAPALQWCKELFVPIVTLSEGGHSTTLFQAALATQLDSSWFPPRAATS